MTRFTRGHAIVGVAAALVLGAFGLLGTPVGRGITAIPAARNLAIVLTVLVGLGVTLLQLRRPGTDARTAGEGTDRLTAANPERTASDLPVAGRDLAALLERAGAAARDGDTVEDGIAVVRPALRETLTTTLVHGGMEASSAEEAIRTGTWTEDAEAAAVLSPDVPPPRRSIRHRLRGWLYPERTTQDRVARAVQAIAEVAGDALPTIPGETAARTIPVVRPTVEELRRTLADADDPRPAVDAAAIDRGPAPSRRSANESADGEGRT